jgi:hypothetical protein
MVLVEVSQTPARSMRRRDVSSPIAKLDPLASNTACTSYPAPTALIVGKTRQMSVVTAAMISCLRPVSATALLKFGSSQALTTPWR